MKFRALSLSLLLLLPATAAVPAQSAAETDLPASLELQYTLHYGALTVGQLVKTLERQSDGSYKHRSHSIPLGLAKMFTSVEWFEEGQFEVVQGKVRPLSFLEYRVGADRSHRNRASFDWKAQKIIYENWPAVALTPGTQDHGSFLFAFMLNPPTPGKEQTLPVSSGKKLSTYRYSYSGSETLKTALGSLKTIVIELPRLDKSGESLRVWLATERNYVPVRITTRQRGEETTLELESIKGL